VADWEWAWTLTDRASEFTPDFRWNEVSSIVGLDTLSLKDGYSPWMLNWLSELGEGEKRVNLLSDPPHCSLEAQVQSQFSAGVI
jgi:hypothetical protein